ncbi:MAG: CPBP family intramembrane metalloprotease [Bacteroidaceae bacterium]|nr:CPBP family intramembrane metalloprotease [Bacteroidaceae bacterium]
MSNTSNELLSTVWRVVKLPLYYMLYQGIFSVLAMIALLVYVVASGAVSVEIIASGNPEDIVSAIMAAIPESGMAWATSAGLFMAASAMLWHLMYWGYFSFGKQPFRQVSGKVMLLSIMLVFAAMFAFNVLAQELGLPDELSEVIKQVSNNVLGCISIAVLGPILEEVLFRGAIQGYLMRKYNPTVGIVVAALVFGLIHMNPIQIFYAFCLGLVFGWMYYRTRSLMPVIIGHVLNNSLAVVTMIMGAEEEDAVMSPAEKIAIIGGSLLAALALMHLINRLQPAVPVPWKGVEDTETQE